MLQSNRGLFDCYQCIFYLVLDGIFDSSGSVTEIFILLRFNYKAGVVVSFSVVEEEEEEEEGGGGTFSIGSPPSPPPSPPPPPPRVLLLSVVNTDEADEDVDPVMYNVGIPCCI